jgi:hypothetical protein
MLPESSVSFLGGIFQAGIADHGGGFDVSPPLLWRKSEL